ncbi:MAG: 6-hydroxymethylpterin diphosphokinase MptE-like protein [Phycisphaerales bacterium]
MPAPDEAIFNRNLLALAQGAPGLARAVLSATPRADARFFETDDAVPSATLGEGDAARQLASRRRPLEEARRLAETVDLAQAAGVLIPGLGLGYHARALIERLPAPAAAGASPLPPWGVVVIFEPDLALLRAALGHIDHSAWLRRPEVVLITEPTQAAIAAAMRGREALPFLGSDVALLEHPAQRSRLGPASAEFVSAFRHWISASRTAVRTTLLNCPVTTRNVLMNLDRYATLPGIADLAGAGAGRAAIVVSAGPSLGRNIALLKRPGIRERFVIIAVQTVLKTLLAEGIRPHFVTALDYHEVSRRFYEGLTGPAAEGVTLVAEPKANPAILSAFPGAIRVPADPFLEELLGEGLSRLMGSLRPGATVAHMAYYLARLLGCDPVILVGQDLGFTDGQYYAAGAAIHHVWSGELSEFRTLEMLEWERIVRGRFKIGEGGQGEPNLQLRTDTRGRAIYTDQQMATYLSQFERDFLEDSARGLSVVDATEGGVAKAHARAMTLADALDAYRDAAAFHPPEPRAADDAPARLRRTLDRVRKVRHDVLRIAERSRETAAILREIIDHQHDQPRVNRLIGRAHAIGEEVSGLRPAFALVQHLNQAGSLKRIRADRAIMLKTGLPPIQRQRMELERDLTNVRWLAEAADELGSMLDATARMLAGGPRQTGETAAAAARIEEAVGQASRLPITIRSERTRIVAVIPIDPARGALGIPRDLAAPLIAGRSALRRTLDRLARCRELDGVLLLATDPAALAPQIGVAPHGLRLDIARVAPPSPGRARAVAAARLWSAHCWRGGLSGLTVYDEVLDPAALAPILEERRIDGAALIGPDWALVDPALIDAAAAQFRQGWSADGSAGRVRLAFCQAPPGLGAAVIDRTLVRELASNSAAGALATIGGRLGYTPVAPMPDPIANLRADSSGKPVCIAAAPAVRDCGLRFIADSAPGCALLAATTRSLGGAWASAGAEEIARHAAAAAPPPLPREYTLELCPGRLTSGPRGQWLRSAPEPVERPALAPALAESLFAQIAAARDDAVLTFFGAGDPLLHPDLPRLVGAARRAGIAGIHIRTDLLGDERQAHALLEAAPDIISVDLMAESAAAYRALMGADLFERARGNLIRLLEAAAPAREAHGGLPFPWIVPRTTRCDGTYEEIEAFYDRWLLGAGAAVIDALPRAIEGQRIEPLPPPAPAARRAAADHLAIRSDGTIAPRTQAPFGPARGIADLTREPLAAAWKRALAKQRDSAPSEPSADAAPDEEPLLAAGRAP